MLKKLAIWYLRKKNVSVLINYRIEDGKVQQLHDESRIYNNEFINVDYRLKNGEKFHIPEGQFKVRTNTLKYN